MFSASSGFSEELPSALPPSRVSGLEEFASWELITNWKTDKKLVVYPRSLYERAYLCTWNEVMYRYGHLGESIEECRKMGLAVALNLEPYSGQGVADGQNQAVDRLLVIERKLGEQKSRELAKNSCLELKCDYLVFRPARTQKNRQTQRGQASSISAPPDAPE
jgi:hypothetical protein